MNGWTKRGRGDSTTAGSWMEVEEVDGGGLEGGG